MPLDDGFVHAWVVRAELDEVRWRPMHREMVLVLRAASLQLEHHRSGEALAVLRGPQGLGPLRLGPNEIAFNGNAFLGHAGDPFAIERRAEQGILSRRGTEGARRAVRRCNSYGYPYDLAVCAVLLVLIRHLADEARVGTSGSLRTGWGTAATLVRATVGDCGQLVQRENGLLRWVDAPGIELPRRVRSSAS